jgi:hypothetical protein
LASRQEGASERQPFYHQEETVGSYLMSYREGYRARGGLDELDGRDNIVVGLLYTLKACLGRDFKVLPTEVLGSTQQTVWV